MSVGVPLSTYVIRHLNQIEQKYFGEMISSNVVFYKTHRGIRFECSLRITCNRGIVFASAAVKPYVYQAFNAVFDNVVSQIHKKKIIMIDTKPINMYKNNRFFELDTAVKDDDSELIDIPALYGHKGIR